MLVVADGIAARFGALGAPFEYFVEWKKIESEQESATEGIHPLVRGMFDKKRFLDIVQHFILFEGDRKKICRYHQYYGVNNTVESAVHSIGSDTKHLVIHK